MVIKICKTYEWSDKEWQTYQQSFNTTFDKDFDLLYFKHKYNTTIDGHTYHALLLNNENNVVGGCSITPFKYKKGIEIIKIGQAVDVFILEEFRIDPLMLRRMYMQLKKLLIDNGIVAVLAVPNAIAYPYWKNIVKWKDVGDLSYWMLPIRVGNIINRWKFLNVLSLALSYIWIGLNSIMMLIANNKQKLSLYELVADENFCRNRYSQLYMKVIIRDVIFYYRIYNEEGVKIAYLIDAKRNEHLSFNALYKGVNYIVRETDADMILYVGPMKLFQTLLIKIPKRFEPKRLPLTCDILNKEDVVRFANMLELKSWNFGLVNYDVR